MKENSPINAEPLNLVQQSLILSLGRLVIGLFVLVAILCRKVDGHGKFSNPTDWI